jgi:PmbA protein
MDEVKQQDPLEVARRAVELAKKKGANAAAATFARAREVELTWRDGKVEKLQEATTRQLSVELFVDGRYSLVTTSDLRPDGLETFLADSVAIARTLAPDPNRGLADPVFYRGQAKIDLGLDDPAQAKVTPDQRKQFAAALEAAARKSDPKGAILSVTTGFVDDVQAVVRVASNGFEGRRQSTSFAGYANVSVKDVDGRRPEEGAYATTRRLADLPSAAWIGEDANRRALGRLGQIKAKSARMNVIVENQTVGRLLGGTLQSLSGAALQQKRSFLEGKLGETIGSAKLNVVDDPHVVRGMASRLWDGEGMATKPRPLFDKGVLRTYFIDSYYGRKLGTPPTTAGTSNLVWTPGDQSLDGLIADAKDGIVVTGFLGGNSNGATGDFSFGVVGYRFAAGRRAEPIGEMNMAGNYLELWKQLAAVGNDPWLYASNRAPSLLFEGISIAGA